MTKPREILQAAAEQAGEMPELRKPRLPASVIFDNAEKALIAAKCDDESAWNELCEMRGNLEGDVIFARADLAERESHPEYDGAIQNASDTFGEWFVTNTGLDYWQQKEWLDLALAALD